jgi:hypothetical protein
LFVRNGTKRPHEEKDWQNTSCFPKEVQMPLTEVQMPLLHLFDEVAPSSAKESVYQTAMVRDLLPKEIEARLEHVARGC